jgi:tetratricopeptide (TPR) repeat protein
VYKPKNGGSSGSGGASSRQDDDYEDQGPSLSCSYCGKTINSRYYHPKYYFEMQKGMCESAEDRAAVLQRHNEDAIYCSTDCLMKDIRELGQKADRERATQAEARDQQALAAVSKRIGFKANWNDLKDAGCPLSESSGGYLHISELKREVKPVYNALINKAGITLPPFEKTIEPDVPDDDFFYSPASNQWSYDEQDKVWKLIVDGGNYGINDIAALKKRMEKRAQFAAPDEPLPENIAVSGIYGTMNFSADNFLYYNRAELNSFVKNKYGKEATFYLNRDDNKNDWFFTLTQKTLFGTKEHHLRIQDIPPSVFAPIRSAQEIAQSLKKSPAAKKPKKEPKKNEEIEDTADDEDDSEKYDFGTPSYQEAQKAYEKGNRYKYNKKDYKNAILQYSLCIEKSSYYAHDEWPYMSRGDAFQMDGQYDKAIEDYNKAIKLNPESFYAYAGRGKVFQLQGQYDKTIKDYSKAIELCPEDTNAYYNRGEVFRLQGQYDKAIKDYSKSIELKPKNAFAYGGRGDAFRLQGQYDKAIEDCSKAIKLYPKGDFAYAIRGATYRAKGDNKQAISDLEKALELDPKREFAQSELKLAMEVGSEKSATAQPEPPAEKPAAKKPAAAKAKFCSECGAELKSGAKFCSECGTKTG